MIWIYVRCQEIISSKENEYAEQKTLKYKPKKEEKTS